MWNKREEFGKWLLYIIIAVWSASEVLFNSTIESVFTIDAKALNSIVDYTILVLLSLQILLL